MYQIKYSVWDERRFPGFRQKLVQLEQVSKQAFYASHGDPNEEKYIDRVLHYLEDYYVSLFQTKLVSKESYSYVLEQLKKMEVIKLFPKDERKYLAITYRYGLSVNPEPKTLRNLSEEDVAFMIAAHEFGHIINTEWHDKSLRYCNQLYSQTRVQGILQNMGLSDAGYLKDGFCLLDEGISQEVAEILTYDRKKQSRPLSEFRNNIEIFNYQPYKTNFNLYGEFQEPVARFARTLNFLHCSPQDSDDEVLTKLARQAFCGDLLDRIQMELEMKPDKMDNFVILLASLGRIKRSTYEKVGLTPGDRKNIVVNSYLSPLQKITDPYVKSGKSW